MTDNLRDRLQAIDPMHPGVAISPVTAPPSRVLLEQIMSTPTVERQTPAPAAPRRRFALMTAAAASVAVVGVIAFTGGSDPDPVASTPLVLGIGESDAMASCLAITPELLAPVPLAFEGTVTSVDGEAVTLTVDRWFKGGEATQVQLTAPDGLQALIGGIDFEVGTRYLVSAFDGVVNYCGFTGEATPELTAIFEAAFTA